MISAYEMSLHLSCYKLSLISVFHSSMKNNFYAIFSCYHESLIFPSNKTDITNYTTDKLKMVDSYYDIQKQLFIYQNNVKLS